MRDDDSGLYYAQARYYDSEIGRFVSIDPGFGRLYDPQSLNKYAYVRNNPIILIDPIGEDFWDFAGGIKNGVYESGAGIYNKGMGMVNSVINDPKGALNDAVDYGVDSAKAIGNSIAHPIETGKAVKSYVEDSVNGVVDTIANDRDGSETGKMIGESLLGVGSIAIPGGVLMKGGEGN